MDIDLIEQLPVFVIVCVDDPEDALKDAHVWQEFLTDAGQVEHQRRITDPVGLHIMVDHFHSSDLFLFIKDRRDLSGDIFPLQDRDLRHIFRAVLFFLVCFQFLRRLHHLFSFFPAQALFVSFQLLGQRLIHLCRASPLRTDDDDGAVSIIQQIFPDQFFKISCVHLALQELKGGDRLHVDKRFLVVIKPAVKKLQSVHQSPRVVSKVRLTEPELMVVDPCPERFLIHPLLCDLPKSILDHTDELLFLLHVRILGNDGEDGLIDPIIVGSHNVLSDARVHQRFFQRSARRGQERIVQDLECKVKLLIQRSPDHLVPGKVGIILLTLVTCDGVFLDHLFHLGKRFLVTDPGIHFRRVKIREIVLVQPAKLLLHIHISVQIDITVGRMIVFPVEIKELLIDQFRDHFRVTAGFICIGCIREKRVQDHPVEHSLRGGKRSLHLIIDNTADGQLAVRVIQLVAPAFLPEDLVMFIDVWIEHSVHVHMHQVLEILVIAARHRVHSLVRIGHRVQERVQRSFHQFYKRIFHREIPGTAQNRVFHDMRNSRAVRGRRAESDGEHFVLIIVFHEQDSRPALFVP